MNQTSTVMTGKIYQFRVQANNNIRSIRKHYTKPCIQTNIQKLTIIVADLYEHCIQPDTGHTSILTMRTKNIKPYIQASIK